jgi:hydroxymethylpyrimidine pyrophosphatase-like HAD family hydrolase
LKANRDLPPPRVIAVDVDGTLHIKGEPNTKAIAWLHKRKAEGYTLMLWSMRGEKHARLIANQFGCVDLFDYIVSKPGFILDDEGWSWIKRTRVIRVTQGGDIGE